ncbi:MAG: peptidoglycan DD-metalloendopeptidase family protein [Pikeienuella sp.]
MRPLYVVASIGLLSLAACTSQSSEPPAPVVFQGTDPTPAPAVQPTPEPTLTQVANAATGPDARGVTFHDGYESITASEGDTVDSMAGRVGISGSSLATYNGLSTQYVPRPGDKLVLPPRPDGYRQPLVSETVAEPATETPAETTTDPAAEEDSGWSISAIAAAIAGEEEAPAEEVAETTETPAAEPVTEPIAEEVTTGETEAVPTEQLVEETPEPVATTPSESVQLLPEGDEFVPTTGPSATLLNTQATAPAETTDETEVAAVDPSASTAENAEAPKETEPTPATSNGLFARPIDAPISRPFSKSPGPDRNDGVDFAAAPGTPVRAAEAGQVTLVSRSIGGLGTILLLRHENGYLSVYGRVDDVKIRKGDRVERGQVIATVAALPSPKVPALHFELRRGADSVDPAQLF